MRFARVLGVIVFAALCVPSLRAEPLYSTGFLDPVVAPFDVIWTGAATNPTAADSFTLTSDAILRSVGVWVYDTIDGTPAGFFSVAYALYAGQAFNAAALIASGSGSNTASTILSQHRSPLPSDGRLNTIVNTFDLAAPITVSAGTYWLAITARTLPSGVSNNARWATSATTTDDMAYVNAGSGWTPVAHDYAFSLEGTRVPETVPEPGTAVTLIMALSAVTVFKRHSEGKRRS